MAQYKISGVINEVNITVVTRKAKDVFGDAVRIEKIERNQSRADRLSEAEQQVADAKQTVEDLKDEMANWKENLPENLQDSQKASELDDAYEALDAILGELDNIDFSSVSFPGMY